MAAVARPASLGVVERSVSPGPLTPGERPPRALSPSPNEEFLDPGAGSMPDNISPLNVGLRRFHSSMDDAREPGGRPISPARPTSPVLEIRPDQPGDDLEHRYDQVLEEPDSDPEGPPEFITGTEEEEKPPQQEAVDPNAPRPAALFLERQRLAVERQQVAEREKELLAAVVTPVETEEQRRIRKQHEEEEIRKRLLLEEQRARELEEKRKREELEAQERRTQEEARRKLAAQQEARAVRAVAEARKRAAEQKGVVGEIQDSELTPVALGLGEAPPDGLSPRTPISSVRKVELSVTDGPMVTSSPAQVYHSVDSTNSRPSSSSQLPPQPVVEQPQGGCCAVL